MKQTKVLKGAFLIALGASSYGMLATFVKLAYAENYSTAEVTCSQFIIGLLCMGILHRFQKKNKFELNQNQISRKDILQLILAGTSMGFTSIFYYLCVRYVNVSIAIILLMQTVWIGVIVELILDKKKPTIKHIGAILLVLLGTFLVTNLFQQEVHLNSKGIFFGFLAAASFTATMFTSNRIALSLPVTSRSFYMLVGGAVIVFIFAGFMQETAFQVTIFYKWGILLALFGTFIPPLLLNAGFPLAGISIGSIVSSIELPVSIIMAYFVLHENIIFEQWLGVLLILLAVLLMNLKYTKNNAI